MQPIINKNNRQMLETLGRGKTNTISTVDKDNYVIEYEEL